MPKTAVPLHQRIDLGPGWQEALEDEFKQPYMEQLAAFVASERATGMPVYPAAPLVFNAFCQTPFEAVKVVIVGQDPYHGPGQAHGLSFSVPKEVLSPPSLKNIFKELQADLGITPPAHGCLLHWAQQGVLLLNATLTVRQGQPKSHFGQGWEIFTDAALRVLLNRNLVFILWGRSARDKVHRLSMNEFCLTSPHPSPLSAHGGFFGCRHFSKANAHLTSTGRAPIDWSL